MGGRISVSSLNVAVYTRGSILIKRAMPSSDGARDAAPKSRLVSRRPDRNKDFLPLNNKCFKEKPK